LVDGQHQKDLKCYSTDFESLTTGKSVSLYR